MSKGKLFLIPNTLGEGETALVLPSGIGNILNSIGSFLVEDERSARRFLKKAGYTGSLDTVKLLLLNEHTDPRDIPACMKDLEEGKNMGILSEAGCPGIADPGAEAVRWAHERDITVVPLVGPSSILLALMASGMNGQQFCFNGYLPKEKADRQRKIKELEKLALQKGQTQLFIEAPYRNMQLLDDILASCEASTRLCIACDITLPTELIRTQSVQAWGKKKPDINKRPAIFIIGK